MDEQVYSSALTVSTLQRRHNNLSQAVEMLQARRRLLRPDLPPPQKTQRAPA
jgi:hypothetical protein